VHVWLQILSPSKKSPQRHEFVFGIIPFLILHEGMSRHLSVTTSLLDINLELLPQNFPAEQIESPHKQSFVFETRPSVIKQARGPQKICCFLLAVAASPYEKLRYPKSTAEWQAVALQV